MTYFTRRAFVRNFILGSVSALSLMACSGESAKTPSAPTFDSAAMDTLLSGAVEAGTMIGASALVYDEGRVVYTGAFGMRDKARGAPVALDTVWRIYSMTKPITSALILDLQEDGLLDLSDPVVKYIPELGQMQVASLNADGHPTFTPQATLMTLEDLMLHRAGIGYGIFGDINPVESLYVKADLHNPAEDLTVKMQKLSQLPLIAQPGTGWYYSASIDILGRVAEVVTGQELDALMAERFFEPLGMTETGFFVRPDQKSRFASNYFLTPEGEFIVEDDGQSSLFLNDNAYHSGGGGLVSTLDDYARFAQLLLDGGIYNGTRILNAETVDSMLTDQMDADDQFMMPWFGDVSHTGFGYGGRVIIADIDEHIEKSGQSKGQFGWGGAARTIFWVDRPNQAFGILMLQYFGGEPPALHDQFQALVYKSVNNESP